MTDSRPPAVADHRGRWDEALAVAILVTPWVVAVAGLVWLAWTGQLRFAGAVPVAPLVYAVGALFAVTYVLALAKVFGARIVGWVVRRARNAARDYNP